MCTWTRRASTVIATAMAAVLITSVAGAQTPFVPYFGKNRVKYDNFNWKIYTTEHFEFYYYPELESHLERIASYAESAYQQISSDLKHDLAEKVPMVVFKTQSEFQQQNVIQGEIPEGVAAFAEPSRDRMLLPIDEPPDQLYRLITHELTHIFEFDIIPRSLIRRNVPLWVDEGLADFMAGVWRPLDLMTVRDLAVADAVPKMSDMDGYGNFTNPRLVYNLGHTAFEFIESKWGKEGIRQFMFSLRKSVIGGGENAYEEAFRVTAEEFDEQFQKYLKDRFKAFRDKERPVDYGKDLAPKPEKTRYSSVLSIEPSPSGDLIAAVAGNRRDQELDVVLISAKDGQVVRNLTGGFDKDKGFEYLTVPGARWNTVPWMSWAPAGDRLAYFVRTEKHRTLIVQNAVTGKIEQRVELPTVDAPESPDISPDGKTVAFSALQGAVGDIWLVNLETLDVQNVTQRRVRRLRAHLVARRQVPRVPVADQRQRQAVPPRSGDAPAHAADVRHPRRCGRAVHRRGDAGLLVDGYRSGEAARAGGRAERQHLQPVDAQPEDGRAAAVHRRLDGQPVARRAARRQ